ncbi:V-type proton ATPase subunit G 1-like isoform X2 [Fukomys damarensis]|uniref:V-type proton ATPase subunit G 1-like isoform X2 n=1 Tax=Fukomys damarensis TaxID=885580 RepID=UPI00053FF2C6|nr:V-type proton ATPase subunit G 1-like isoform X2 [Fukomys damarensis]
MIEKRVLRTVRNRLNQKMLTWPCELQQPWPASHRGSSSCRPRSRPQRRCWRLASTLGSHGRCSNEVEKETQEKMTILQTYFRQNREKILDNLLAFICDIWPKIP